MDLARTQKMSVHRPGNFDFVKTFCKLRPSALFVAFESDAALWCLLRPWTFDRWVVGQVVRWEVLKGPAWQTAAACLH